MKSQIKIHTGDVSFLMPLVEEWVSCATCNLFNYELYPEPALASLQRLASKKNSVVFILYKEDEPIGFMGMYMHWSSFGSDRIAEECYFYVLPKHRGMSSIRLIRFAKEWAVAQRCTQMVLNVSEMATDSSDRVVGLYEKLGWKKVQTSFIKRI